MKTSEMKVLFVGFGYCAQHLYHDFFKDHRALAISRTRTSIEGYPHIQVVTQLPLDITHILICAPPHEGTDSFYQTYHHLFPELSQLEWVGYLSSTSVYGDHKGAWVDETSVCHPTTTQGRERLYVEGLYLNTALPIHIFRLAGIYGAQRSVFDQLQRPDAVRIDHVHKFSRIHASDIACSLYASMSNPTPGHTYNLSDHCPAASRLVCEYACDLLQAPYPPLVPLTDARISNRMREFYCDHKQVDGNKIRRKLGFEIQYPSYKEGLDAIYATQTTR